ncbi:MAG: hypothetical protein QOK48_1966 [Blastocatellia bacterium]|nr:hypothetical protein [Blastocatellia bacterium]
MILGAVEQRKLFESVSNFDRDLFAGLKPLCYKKMNQTETSTAALPALPLHPEFIYSQR